MLAEAREVMRPLANPEGWTDEQVEAAARLLADLWWTFERHGVVLREWRRDGKLAGLLPKLIQDSAGFAYDYDVETLRAGRPPADNGVAGIPSPPGPA